MGPLYTRSLTNTISSTPMKINSKFFLSQVQLSSSWISDTVILFVAFYWTSLSCNSFNAPYFVQWLDEIDRRNRCWLLWTRLLKSDNLIEIKNNFTSNIHVCSQPCSLIILNTPFELEKLIWITNGFQRWYSCFRSVLHVERAYELQEIWASL